MAAIGLQLPPMSPQGLPQESSSIEAFVTQDTEEAGEGEEALLWRKMIADLLQETPSFKTGPECKAQLPAVQR